MTNEEAIKWFEDNMPEWVSEGELYCGNGFYGSGEMVCTEPEGYFYKKAIKALESLKKYAWHDLRKNPEDLPKEGQRILFYTIPFDDEYELRTWTGMYSCNDFCNDDYEACVTNGSYGVEEVIAWREIEPFESEVD